MKPVLYLDVDGVLWDYVRESEKFEPTAARGLDDFLALAFEHFEVRWCTAWALTGTMDAKSLNLLASYTGVPRDTWRKVRPSCGWWGAKFRNFDMAEIEAGRPFVWVEDDLTGEEYTWLNEHGFRDRYFYTDVFENPDALIRTTARLRDWLEDLTP